jgi:hypothetical protein
MTQKRLRAPQKTNRRKIFIGGTLVLLSAAGVWLTIETNNRTEEFLVAAKSTSGGTFVTPDDFRVIRANLSDSRGLYLRPGQVPAGSYLLFSAENGQLVPKSWVASAVLDGREPVVITSTMPLPTSLKVGDLVNVWVSKKQESGKYAQPVELVLNAEVSDLTAPSGMMADQNPAVQILVPTASVAAILDAVASKDALSLVLQRNLGNE